MEVHKPLNIKPGELRCPSCRAKDIVPSMPRGIWDGFMRWAGREPRHCRACGRRFHAFRERERVKEEEAEDQGQ